MLAKELKIKTILKQRSFIENGLSLVPNNKDGDPSFRYVGYLYPENRRYFEELGYDIWKKTSDQVLAFTKGLPLYLFNPKEQSPHLTEEELEEAKKYQLPPLPTDEELHKTAEHMADEFMAMLFGDRAPYPESDNDEEDGEAE